MGALSRRKGAQFEREVAERIRETVGVEAVRNLEECRDGNTGDIKCPTLPIVWQCKVGARPDIYGAVSQAEAAAWETAKYAVAVIKRNGSRHTSPAQLAVLRLGDFLEIVATLRKTGAW